MDNNYYDLEKIKSAIREKIYQCIITHNSYNIIFYSNGLCVDNLYVTNMNIAISQAIYSINHTNLLIIDQVQIYKNGTLIAELNK